mmetsp:Transcript_9498/g.28567  ORF Transcript_9498/g.28567 Transcript_9498/m.28567 type:complete len:238 (+) Transcript_9498:1412-2125(+)
MRAGPTSQLSTREMATCFSIPGSRSSLPSTSYRTLVRTGHIMSQSPMAIGRLTVSTFTVSNFAEISVNSPSITPNIMAPMIQKLSSLSVQLSCLNTLRKDGALPLAWGLSSSRLCLVVFSSSSLATSLAAAPHLRLTPHLSLGPHTGAPSFRIRRGTSEELASLAGTEHENVEASESSSAGTVVPSFHLHSTPSQSVCMPSQLMTKRCTGLSSGQASSQYTAPTAAMMVKCQSRCLL